jgi:hypothetical protein
MGREEAGRTVTDEKGGRAKGEGGAVETNEDGAVTEEPELENEEAITKGERDVKSIIPLRRGEIESVNAERTDDESVNDPADSACACARVLLGVDTLLIVRDEGLFIDSITVIID